MRPSPSSTALLLTTFSLSSIALAQNSTSSNGTDTECSADTQWLASGKATVNSTGQQEFKWTSAFERNLYNESWYVSVLINDTSRGKAASASSTSRGVQGRGYISVPNSIPNDTSLCIYQFGSLNATLSPPAPGEHSCKGALSPACTDFLNRHWVAGGGDSCPDFYDGTSTARDAFKKACPGLGSGGTVRDTGFREVSNTTCTLTELPGVQIPEGYHTFGTPSAINPYEGVYLGSNATQAYDLMARQVVPYVLLATFKDEESGRGQTATEFVCVVPNKTVEGSRVPEGEVPWSGGNVLDVRRVPLLVAGVLVMFFLL